MPDATEIMKQQIGGMLPMIASLGDKNNSALEATGWRGQMGWEGQRGQGEWEEKGNEENNGNVENIIINHLWHSTHVFWSSSIWHVENIQSY